MKSLNIKLNLNGSISVKEVDSLFLNENNACEVSIDYSSVVKEGWSIAVDLQPQYEQATEINSTTPGFILDENNVFMFFLSENYTKRNELRIQPKQVKSNGTVMDKIKYDVYTKKFKQSVNATESEEAVGQSIADQILASEQVRDSNENVRIANENARLVYENYNPLTPYVVGNKVSHSGSSYACILDTTGNLPTDSTYWLLIASQGDQGKSIVSASFVDNDIVFVNDDNEEIVIEGGKSALIGSSAYQVWLDEGNEGTVEDYLESLKGEVTLNKLNDELSKKSNIIEPLFKSTADSEVSTLGSELLDGTGWTSIGWTGDFINGFTHTTGNTNTLIRTLPSTSTKYYQVSFSVNAPLLTNELFISIGDSAPFDLYNGEVKTEYIIGIKSVSDGNLIITPISSFNKTISNLSVKEVIGIATPSMKFTDSNNVIVFEMRTSKNNLLNYFLGKSVGGFNTGGHENVAVGNESMQRNIGGFWNVALGTQALRDNVNGSRNVALGQQALSKNISGHRNVGIGSSSLIVNTLGNYNVAIGCDTLYKNTIGNNNVAIGFEALLNNLIGNNNVALGYDALVANVNGNDNVAIGYFALQRNTVSENVGIGKYSMYGLTTGIENTAIGTGSLQRNVTGQGNVGIGYNAGYGASGTSYHRNTIIGDRAGILIGEAGNDNTLIGYKAGDSITTGKRNICIGSDVDVTTATGDDQLNIGNVIKGNLSTKKISLEKLLLTNLPTSNPLVAGEVWNDNGTLKISTGA